MNEIKKGCYMVLNGKSIFDYGHKYNKYNIIIVNSIYKYSNNIKVDYEYLNRDGYRGVSCLY